MNLNIVFINKQRKYILDFSKYKLLVIEFFKNKVSKNIFTGNEVFLYISFLSSKNIRNLKNTIFNLNITTDVISLPMDTDLLEIENCNNDIPMIFGEIFICPEVAFLQSKKFNNTFDEEIELLLVHGLLHLIGYDDILEKDKLIMREEEKNFLNIFRKKEAFYANN